MLARPWIPLEPLVKALLLDPPSESRLSAVRGLLTAHAWPADTANTEAGAPSCQHTLSLCLDLHAGKLPLIYICNIHVLSHLLLIYICKLHWNPAAGLSDLACFAAGCTASVSEAVFSQVRRSLIARNGVIYTPSR